MRGSRGRAAGTRRTPAVAVIVLISCAPLVTATQSASASTCTITGTSRGDRLVGTSGNDVLCGLGGNDVLIGKGGNDVLIGGSGNDTLWGGAGSDALQGRDGNDVLIGGPGADRLFGGTGADTASYQDHASAVAVRLGGTAHNGSAGENDLVASDVESAVGGTADDTLVGNGAANVLKGGTGNDNLTGGAGNDVLSGGDGNDSLEGGGGTDTIAGGAGNDIVSYVDHTTAVDVSLDGHANDGAPGEDDSIGAGVEGAVGGSGNDTITGNGGPNTLVGGSGADNLTGGTGNDNLTGGPGNDVLSGGDGSDSLEGGGGTDTIGGGAGTDIVSYVDHTTAVDVSLDGHANDGAPGEDDSIGADVEGAVGGSGNDTITGNGGPNTLVGGSGADNLTAADGNDNLAGGTGDDVLDAGSGTDVCSNEGGTDFGLSCDSSDAGLYGWEGYAVVRHGEPISELHNLAIDIDAQGQLVGAGSAHLNGTNRDPALFRLTRDGLPDTTFGDSGTKLLRVPGGFGDAFVVRHDSQGRLLLGGSEGSDDHSHGAYVRRLLPDGTPDPTFGADSYVWLGNWLENVGDLVVLPNDHVLAAVNENGHSSLVELDSSGDLDPSFGSGGIVSFPLGTGSSSGWYLTKIAVSNNGDYVWAAGIQLDAGGSCGAASAFVVRLTIDGAVDDSFNGGAPLTLQHSVTDPPNTWIGAIAPTSDGSLMVTGTAVTLVTFAPQPVELQSSVFVARVDASGLDTSFGTNGFADLDLHAGNDLEPACGTHELATDVAVTRDGHVLVGGSADIGETSTRIVVRLTSDGALDPTFGAGGRFGFAMPATYTGSTRVAELDDGEILVAAAGGSLGVVVARIAADGKSLT